MDSVALLQKVIDETTRVVDNISPAQLMQPSPCAGWAVRDVINHITGGATMFAISAEQGAVPDEMIGQLMGGDNIGDDPQGAFKKAADHALAAFHEPGVLDKMVTLPFGTMPAGIALNIAVFDVAVHACDIAHASGQKITDDATFTMALGIGQEMVGPDLRQPGVFDAEQSVPAGATIQERLLAFAGRKI
ncbi:MAG: TIGR03086 family metal-binding protein [Actinomycetota bacterium]